MDIVYYCSYKTSPVGFQLGVVSFTSSGNMPIQLQRNGIPDITARTMESSEVAYSYGKLPGQQIYEILRKKITGNKGDPHYDPIILSFSVICCSYTEYSRAITFVDNCKNDAELFSKFADPIVICPNDEEFGIRIDNGKLNKLYDDIMRSEPRASLDEQYYIVRKNGDIERLTIEDQEVSKPRRGPFRVSKNGESSPGGANNQKGKDNRKDHNRRYHGNHTRVQGGAITGSNQRQKKGSSKISHNKPMAITIVIAVLVISICAILMLLKSVYVNTADTPTVNNPTEIVLSNDVDSLNSVLLDDDD